MSKILKNKATLINKKHANLTEDLVNAYTQDEAQVQLDLLESAFSTYCTEHEKVMEDLSDSDAYNFIDVLENVSNTYIKTKSLLVKHIRSRKTLETCTETTFSSNDCLRLPKLDIPKFSGNVDEWYEFKDQYTSIIHNNNTLDNTRKIYYLKSCLSGNAAQVIASISAVGNNYQDAWSLLKRRYDNKRLIVQFHVQQLLTQPSVLGENAQALKKLMDTTNKHLRALTVYEVPVEHWDTIILGIVTARLPADLRKAWEIEAASYTNMPNWQLFTDFVENRIHALEVVQARPLISKPKFMKTTAHTIVTPKEDRTICPVCSQAHKLYQCTTFMSSTPQNRKTLAKKSKLCLNCLRIGHYTNQCTMEQACKTCGLKHHTLLHFGSSTQSNNQEQSSNKEDSPQLNTSQEVMNNVTATTAVHQSLSHNTSTVLLSTALVKVHGPHGKSELCRALLDSASQSHFVTASLANRLGLKKVPQHVIIDGVANATTSTSEAAEMTISSRINNQTFSIMALVSPKITVDLPTTYVDIHNWTHLNNVKLADPTFNTPGKIDLLLSAEIFMEFMEDGKLKGPPNTPTLQNSTFGWIVAGRTNNLSTNVCVTHAVTYLSLENLVQRFWTLEEGPRLTTMSVEDQLCEEHYKHTHQRDTTGRYVLRLPFKEKPPTPNNSYVLAVQRLLKIEKNLSKNVDLGNQYRAFMENYEKSDHMRQVKPTDCQQPVVFIPHHHVCNPNSTTTKLRVVFDGSCVMNSGRSLNDYLQKGPKLQRDIMGIIMRFRFPKYVLAGDIKQMFRQLQIHPDDRVYQGIVWRQDPSQPIQMYKLNTVTYGLVSSPYQAIRTLQQLAQDEASAYPLAANTLLHDFYVDEVMTGTDTINETLDLYEELVRIMAKGGFELRKWTSNSITILQHIPLDWQVMQVALDDPMDTSIKILGIFWHSQKDCFLFQCSSVPAYTNLSKRVLLSEISRIYDPCGWLAPVVIVSKLMIQQLWKEGISWDDMISKPLQQQWTEHRVSLEHLNNFKIPRHLNPSPQKVVHYSLHGFSDSSEKAYAAVLYIISHYQDGSASVNLLASKTRVAPLKIISIPRLELCGAHLLAQLVHSVMQELNRIPIDSIHLWSDSTITLQWILSDAHRWNTFVSNRVSQIQTLMPKAIWRHVPTEFNPADVASRGLSGQQLISCDLWWYGPVWLPDSSRWPKFDLAGAPSTNIEEKPPRLITVAVTTEVDIIISKYSNFESLLRVIALMLRFIHNCRVIPVERRTGFITVMERCQASNFLIKYVQHSTYKTELTLLKKGLPLKYNSSIANLDPFVDSEGILRVGGRLHHSELSYDCKHPIILPKTGKFTILLIQHVHLQNLHSGLNITMTQLRQKYWVVHARSTVRRIIHNCVICFRYRKVNTQQLMANLPAARVIASPAFEKCGVDFAGPFLTKLPKVRTKTVFKSYLALFVCFTTKAIHLEIVSDLTTEAFIATLRRFIARRGYPSQIHSDNGTNFVGSHNYLKELFQLLASKQLQEKVHQFCLPHEIEWIFNPPSAPHWGGLWESNIKSSKSILQRIMKTTVMTYEELSTLFCQVEAVLNSRPLGAQSQDCTDYNALTPGHFLIGRALNALPSEDLSENPTNRLNRWKLIQKMHQLFWKQWSSDYLSTMQQRTKWRQSEPDLQEGDLVLIKEDNRTPGHWPMGRIVATHPNTTDHKVRVVTVKTQNSKFVRPITKLVRLPIS